MAQRFQLKALAKHRGGLQGLLVGRRQSIDARENEALDRRRDIAVAMLLHVAQQLFQEKRVALRTLDAVERRLIDGLDERTCQPDGIFFRQGGKIQRHKGQPPVLLRHAWTERISLDARGHDKQALGSPPGWPLSWPGEPGSTDRPNEHPQ